MHLYLKWRIKYELYNIAINLIRKKFHSCLCAALVFDVYLGEMPNQKTKYTNVNQCYCVLCIQEVVHCI